MIKYTLAALALTLALSTSAHAQNEEPVAVSIEFCTTMASLAETVMVGRQVGVPMDKMMGQAFNTDGSPNELAMAIVNAAFSVERYSSEEYQTRAAQDFRSAVFQNCYETRRYK